MADEPAGRAWARAKFDWLDRVADNLAGRHLVFCVAHALLRDTDKATGITGIAQREIAEKIVAGLRSVQLAIDALEGAGFLTVIKPKGPRLGNRYRLHLPPEPSKGPSLAQSGALKTEPGLAQPSALKGASLAQPSAPFSESQCAPYPRSSPVEDHPRQGATAPPTPKTTTIGDAEEDGLLDQIRQAIEAAGGKLAKRRHQLQPIRDLIAGGIPRGEVVASIAAAASRLKGPLGNLDPAWLLDHVRDRAAADGYGISQPVDGSTTAKPAEGPKRRTPSGTDWPETSIVATVASGFAGGWWPQDWGPRPGRPGCEVEGDLIERGRAIVVKAVDAWKAGQPWDDKLGPHPDISSALAPDFLPGVRMRDGAWFTPGGLDHLLRVLANSPEDFEWEFPKYFRALPSPLDAEDCTLPFEWQLKALEYRAAKS